jgi:2-keto-3-deoxy-L-rhamnonate aldolase RhmA
MLVAAVSSASAQPEANPLITLWAQGKPAFGVFVPDEKPVDRRTGSRPSQRPAAVYTREGARKLAANPLYDFVFLNLEGHYDAAAIEVLAEGLRGARGSRKALMVRIPTIEAEGAAAARARVKEAFDLGADGVTIPHVRNVDEARLAIGFFADARVNAWSPSNPDGDRIAMLMLEDPGAVAQAAAIADLKGYSALACGIGSLTRALGNDARGGEAGTQKVLAETRRVKLPNMLTATTGNVEQRVKEGFLGILAIGDGADEAITIGLKAAGRQAAGAGKPQEPVAKSPGLRGAQIAEAQR